MNIIKIGRVELSPDECAALYRDNKRYIAQYKDIYCIHYSKNAGFYGSHIAHYSGAIGITARGRWIACNAEQINSLVGRDIVTA